MEIRSMASFVEYWEGIRERTKRVVRLMPDEAFEWRPADGRGIGDAALQARCVRPAGASIATWKWLRAMVEHEVHHRGQIYLMLAMIGVPTPPMFALTSEEVLQNSLPSA
jgi:hypothetical protein